MKSWTQQSMSWLSKFCETRKGLIDGQRCGLGYFMEITYATTMIEMSAFETSPCQKAKSAAQEHRSRDEAQVASGSRIGRRVFLEQ